MCHDVMAYADICTYVRMCVCDCVCVCMCVCVCIHVAKRYRAYTQATDIYIRICVHIVRCQVCMQRTSAHLLLHARKINTFPHAKETPAPYLFLLPPLPSSVYVRMYRCGHGCFVGIGTRSQVFMYISQDLL